MELNRITVVRNSCRTANGRIVIVRRYVYSISAAERLDCPPLEAKALASPGSSRSCRQLPPGIRGILESKTEKNIYPYLLVGYSS